MIKVKGAQGDGQSLMFLQWPGKRICSVVTVSDIGEIITGFVFLSAEVVRVAFRSCQSRFSCIQHITNRHDRFINTYWCQENYACQALIM